MLYGENRTNTNGYRYQRTLDAPTQKLFKAIDDENLEDFRQAIEEGADVYARDEKNMRPLESIKDKLVNVLSNKSACAVSSDKQKTTLKKMTKLLTTKQLFKAIGDKNLENFKQAIKEGADVYARDEKGMTPLMIIARARVYDRQQPVLKEMVTLLLFKAIGDENLEAFKQALAEGANVNAFDEEGMTPLMSIINVCAVSGDGQATLEKMAKLLIQNSSIDINAQSREYVYEERQKRDRHGRLVYLFCGQEVAEVQTGYYIYCNDGRSVDNVGDSGERRYFNSYYDGVKEKIRTSKIQKNTALHIACQVGARDMVKILLTHPGVETDIRNYECKSSVNCIARGFEDVIKLEFKKAQKANELLGALASRDFYQANMLLNEELNPNCWRRMRHGEIATPLSSIIILCPEKITENGKEVFIKLLKHKELDLNQIKSTPAMIERKQLRKIIEEKQLKQIIEQAIKERLIDAINSKNLDDVKKLVEDNDFMNYAIIIAAWRNVNNPIESIKNYLNEKFPANTNNIPEDFEKFLQGLVDELERTKAQLVEKEQELTNKTGKISQLEKDLVQVRQEKSAQQSELIEFKRIVCGRASDTVEISRLKRDLKQVMEERDRLSSENRLLRTKSLSNKNEKSSQAISPGRKLSNYASAAFVLSGAFAVGACLAVLYDYPVIGACLAAVALVLLLVGYFLYKGDEKNIGPGSATDNPRVTRVLASSPNFVGNSYTY